MMSPGFGQEVIVCKHRLKALSGRAYSFIRAGLFANVLRRVQFQLRMATLAPYNREPSRPLEAIPHRLVERLPQPFEVVDPLKLCLLLPWVVPLSIS
jgi:hypothetical protein